MKFKVNKRMTYDEWCERCKIINAPQDDLAYYIREQARVSDWQYRCGYELMRHEQSCFVTLTYAEAPAELNHRDVQLFFKRLRKKYSFRYFGCGEYGGKYGRPHYHAILFGYFPSDIEYMYGSGTERVYKSYELARMWKLGYVSVQPVTSVDVVRYCCKYMQKASVLKSERKPPYQFMSRRPGIGCDDNELIDYDHDIMYMQGRHKRICRYYLERLSSSERARIKCKRREWLEHVLSDEDSDRQARGFYLQYLSHLKKFLNLVGN